MNKIDFFRNLPKIQGMSLTNGVSLEPPRDDKKGDELIDKGILLGSVYDAGAQEVIVKDGTKTV